MDRPLAAIGAGREFRFQIVITADGAPSRSITVKVGVTKDVDVVELCAPPPASQVTNAGILNVLARGADEASTT